MIKLVLFDLDGTLVDSLPTITDCSNHLYRFLGLPEINEDNVRNLVGYGLHDLINKLVPDTKTNSKLMTECINVYSKHYYEFPYQLSRLYPGIIDLLKELSQLGIKTGVITNKEDKSAQMVFKYFLDDNVQLAVGVKDDIKPKPDPSGVLSAIRHFNCELDECIFVGDMETDINVAKNSGIKSVGVSWGYLGREKLQDIYPDYIVDKPIDIMDIVKGRQ